MGRERALLRGADPVNAAQRLAALETEADRIKVRLDNLNRFLTGEPDAWFEIMQHMNPEVAEISINAPLAEARQQALALVAVTKAIAALMGEEKAPADTADPADAVANKRKERQEAALRRKEALL